MNKLICYTGGGLCNRILPLISFIELSRIENRQLLLYWPTDRICESKFNDFFDNDIQIADLDFLNSLKNEDTQFYCKRYDAVINEVKLYNRKFLSEKMKQNVLMIGEQDDFLIKNNYKNILACSPIFLNCIRLKENLNISDYLSIKKDIVNDAYNVINELNINKTIIGAHLRGSDFNKSFSYYENQILDSLRDNPNAKILISSSEQELENYIKKKFPYNIIIRNNKQFVKKYNSNLPWMNNLHINSDQIRDAIIDAIILSKTNFRIYDANSTFVKFVQILSNH
jgi:hypothetical protein